MLGRGCDGAGTASTRCAVVQLRRGKNALAGFGVPSTGRIRLQPTGAVNGSARVHRCRFPRLMALHPRLAYTEHALMPGRPMFRCDRMSATMQVTSCASMWERSNLGPIPKTDRCRGCELGAVHAGQSVPDASAIRGLAICPRCAATDKRLIKGLLCVSCYNREREVLIGRNAKGKRPERHPPVAPRAVAFVCQGEARVLKRECTVSSEELVVELLRDMPAKVLVGWGKGKALASLGGSLW